MGRKALPLGATATTAASGGNREELLGPRPAGCKRQRSRRWEPQPGLGAKRLRGQARHERTAHAAIGILFVRAILSLRPRIIVSILALSVTCGDTSPRGRGFVRTGKVCKKLQKPLANFPEMRYNTSRGKSAGNRISASLAQSVRAPDC